MCGKFGVFWIVMTFLIILDHVTTIPVPSCCSGQDERPRNLVYGTMKMTADLEEKLYREMAEHVLVQVERHSLMVAGLLTSITFTFLLVGTFVTSCRSQADYTEYEKIPTQECDSENSANSRTGKRIDENCNKHLYPEPFRDGENKHS